MVANDTGVAGGNGRKGAMVMGYADIVVILSLAPECADIAQAELDCLEMVADDRRNVRVSRVMSRSIGAKSSRTMRRMLVQGVQ